VGYFTYPDALRKASPSGLYGCSISVNLNRDLTSARKRYSGTGKSHLLITLGAETAMAVYHVRYILATKLVNELVEAADDKQLTKTINRYGRVDLLGGDLGYMDLDRRGVELLFQVLAEEKRRPPRRRRPAPAQAAVPPMRSI
jgi:hypothetical protein